AALRWRPGDLGTIQRKRSEQAHLYLAPAEEETPVSGDKGRDGDAARGAGLMYAAWSGLSAQRSKEALKRGSDRRSWTLESRRRGAWCARGLQPGQVAFTSPASGCKPVHHRRESMGKGCGQHAVATGLRDRPAREIIAQLPG
ncbi:hypothetical protein CYMTET_54795, partial [Cymbomonas tetramitiformis]